MTTPFGDNRIKQEAKYRKILEKFLLAHVEYNVYLVENELWNLVLDDFNQGFENLQNNIQGDSEHLQGVENYIQYLKDSWGLTTTYDMIPKLREIFYITVYLRNTEGE